MKGGKGPHRVRARVRSNAPLRRGLKLGMFEMPALRWILSVRSNAPLRRGLKRRRRGSPQRLRRLYDPMPRYEGV